MAARERGLAKKLVRIDAGLGQHDHGHDIARGGVGVGEGDRLSLQVLQTLVGAVRAHRQDRQISGRAVQPFGGHRRLDAAVAIQPRGCVPGTADTRHLQVSGDQCLADAGVIRGLEQLDFDAQLLLGVGDVDVVAIDGRHLIFERQNTEVDRRVLGSPIGVGGRGCDKHDGDHRGGGGCLYCAVQ